MNSLKKCEGVPLLNFEGGSWAPTFKFWRVSWVPLLNFEEGPGSRVLVPLLHHVKEKLMGKF